MRMTVCGSAGSHPSAGRACSGYLLESPGARIMLDMGNGSTSNLQLVRRLRELDAIIITHRHIDHCIDVIGSFYSLMDDVADHPPLPIYAAPDVLAFLTSLLSRDSTLDFNRVYDARTIEAGDHLEIGDLSLDFLHSIHPAPTVSVRIREGDLTFAYSSDSAGGDDLVEAARDANVFLCEATWDTLEGRPEGIHLDGHEAGTIARKAGVDRLLLTHVAGNSDRDRIQREAEAAFGTAKVHQVEDQHFYDL